MQTLENAAFNFNSEASLEDFVWQNLQELLSLSPLNRQHYIKGQVCDILATALNKQLVVIELIFPSSMN
ncbi:hypothetical protein [Aliterella atlantica]|uniref:Uncharacterized protein n=1 Tax=Aliterella atlantica CENA595 TaxID=1618023 RepID=A0A0D8ZL01_9CYAN|nr:hypothetical protein UH38_23445 [Aliterella atlantica CENA595]